MHWIGEQAFGVTFEFRQNHFDLFPHASEFYGHRKKKLSWNQFSWAEYSPKSTFSRTICDIVKIFRTLSDIYARDE